VVNYRTYKGEIIKFTKLQKAN